MRHSSAPMPTHFLHFPQLVRVVRTLILVGAILLAAQPLLLLASGLWGGTEFLSLAEFLGLPGPPVGEATRWRTALVSLIPVGSGLYTLLQLWRLFGEYGNGRVFGAAAQGALVRFAWAVLLLSLLMPLARGLMSVAQSLGNAPGQRFLELNFAWFDGFHILLGAVMVAIACVMAEARRIADDNAGFV